MGTQGDPPRDVSMADVARMAGTSKSTVSRVLANRGPVSAGMRERVLTAARTTKFVPNAAASALARSRNSRPGFRHNSLAVAFCVTDTGFSHFWDSTYEGLLGAAHELELGVVSCLVRQAELQRGVPPPTLARAQFDGLLILPTAQLDYHALLTFGPTVVFGRSTEDDCRLPTVAPDNRLGVATLVKHLCSLGHRRLEFVAHKTHRFTFRERIDAFGHAARGLVGDAPVRHTPDDSIEAYADDFVRRPAAERPTALMTVNDNAAIQIINALHHRGVHVPQQVSVAGFDGIAAGALCAPPLTTWQVNWHEVGRQAVRMLADMISQRTAGARVLVGGGLIPRASTACLETPVTA